MPYLFGRAILGTPWQFWGRVGDSVCRPQASSDSPGLLSQCCDNPPYMKKLKKTMDAAKILHQRYIKKSRKRKESLQRERENIGIAEQV
jgi:hypothetical protein